jgi:hypothetical protein
MRAYEIIITDPNTGKEIYKISSKYLGRTEPNALNIELDIPVTTYDTPIGGAFVRIWGIGIKLIGQSYNFNGMDIAVYAGMAKGLPLANPKQYGLILEANIFQAFGNWQGTSQSLDFIVLPKTGRASDPVNLELKWSKGSNLADAIVASLKTAFPTKTIQSGISTTIVANEDVTATYYNLFDFAKIVNKYSKAFVNKATYYGIKIGYSNNSIYLFDGSKPLNSGAVIEPAPVQSDVSIKFNELIGQPTWIAPATIQFKTPIRNDIKVGDYVTMPNTLQTTLPQSQSQFRNRSAFSGKFMVYTVRHIGNFRQRDANAWVTTYDAIQTTNL